MASLRYAARYRCDFCGKIADIPPPEGPGIESPGPPPGWLLRWSRDAQLRIIVETANGEQFGDACDECMTLPLGALLVMVAQKLGAAGQPG